MDSVCLIDTSVLCNIVRVPGKCDDADSVMAELREMGERAGLLLPVAAVVETGNHVAQNGNGRERRTAALALQKVVVDAVEQSAPWRLASPFNADALRDAVAEWETHAVAGVGIADRSIILEWERQCELNPGRRVRIWALDGHLAGYDRAPLV